MNLFFSDIEEEKKSLLVILGPLFLLCTVMLAAKPALFNYDLLAVAAIGLFLSAKWRVRGSVYALVILGIAAVIKHLLLHDHHLWQLGLESSVGFALLISALAFEETSNAEGSLLQQIETRESTIRNLEEELARHQEERSSEQIAMAEKFSLVTQRSEETQADLSSLQILNEVLRKKTAKVGEEKEFLASERIQLERRMGQLLEEAHGLQSELRRVKDESSLAMQNGQLFKELNEARMKEAQTHLVNETVVRLHAKESQRARELSLEREQLVEEIKLARQEVEAIAERLKVTKEQCQEAETLAEQLKAASARADLVEKQLVEEMKLAREESGAVAERLKVTKEQCQEAETLAEQLKAARDLVEKENGVLKEQLQFAESKPKEASHSEIEPLYRQLRAQFKEKNDILHQVRVKLFLADTELQTLKMEMQQKALVEDLISPAAREEIEVAERESAALSEENHLLQDLVSHLMSEDSLKKKI